VNCALDFEGAIAGEKYRCRMRVDALHRRASMGRRIGQKRKHVALAIFASVAIVHWVAVLVSLRCYRLARATTFRTD